MYGSKTVLGIHKIDNKIKYISREAGLSEIFPNPCLRATWATVLSNAWIKARNVMAVTGHHNEGSIKSYIRDIQMDQWASMCKILHSFGKSNVESASASDMQSLVLQHIQDT